MNDHYIYVNKQSLIGGVIRFKFPYNDMSRVPNMSIKLIQGTCALTDHYPDGIICKMTVPASNYSSDDNKGTALGHFMFLNKSSTLNVFAYLYQPMESPSYNIGVNNTFIELNFYGADGTLFDSDIDNVNLLFKLSFPKPDELEMDYRSRVPLPSRLI